MSSINSCTFSGRVGKDAVTRYTPSNKAITNFSVAVDTSRSKDEKTTMWVSCVIWDWGNKVEHLLKKGVAITVSGQIELQEYESNGETRQSLKLTIGYRGLSIQSYVDPGQGQHTGGCRARSEPKKNPQQQTLPEKNQAFDDDIPF